MTTDRALATVTPERDATRREEPVNGGLTMARRPSRSASGEKGRPRHPTLEQAFEAFCTLLAFAVGSRGAAATYDQRANHLPNDAKSADQYKRWHRAARRAGLAGVWTRGKLLVATAEAWSTPLPRNGRRDKELSPGDDELDAALGIRAAGGVPAGR